MAKSSIHIQGGKIGFFSHNSRESKTVNAIFKDESNYISCDNKTAIKNFKDELELRTLKYLQNHTSRTKLHSKTLTHLSAIVNFNKEHTPEDIKKVCDYLEKTLDTKVIQFAMHRDEGHINSKNEAIKNYHAHIEFMGLDSEGNSIRRKLDKKYLINLQNEVANILQMERGKNYTQLQEPRPKRLDTYEYKKTKEKESKEITKEKNKIIVKANEIIKDERTQKKIIKAELEKLNEENKSLRAELQIYKSERTVYAELEALNKKLKSDLETGRKNFDLVKQELETFKDKYLKTKSELNLVECKAIDLKEELEEIKLEVYHPKYKTESGNQVTNKTVANFFEKELNKKDLEIVDLKKENKSLQEQKKVLEYKVTTLQEKIIPSSNMSDYEQIKKENEELKKENKSLKEKIKNIISQANEKIKELFRFKIFTNTALANDDIDWKKECDDDIRLEVRYKRGIESELVQYQEEAKEKDYFKSKLDDMVTNTKNMKTELEKSTQLLKKMFPEKEKKKEEEYHHHRDNFHHR